MKWLRQVSAGGWLAMVCWSVSLTYLAWGASTPRLEKMWELESALKTGQISQMNDDDRNLFYGILNDYPSYGESICGDNGVEIISWEQDDMVSLPAYVLRAAQSKTRCDGMTVWVDGEPSVFPATLVVAGKGNREKLLFATGGKHYVPFNGDNAELLELYTESSDIAARIDVKVTLCQ